MAANDSFGGRGGSIDSPASGGEAVTAHDTTEFATVSRAIYVGGAGNVAAVMADGTVLTFVGVQAGTLLPIRCKRINSTNTTATSMVALY